MQSTKISPRANIPLDQRPSKPITQRFADYVANPLRSDFKFIISDDGNVEIPAHKFIVGAGSLVLDHILYGTDGLASVDSTVVNSISASAFTELLRFIYTDDANITADNAIEIMIKANYYDIQQLEMLCVTALLDSIDRDHCCHIYSRLFAYFSYTEVVKRCLKFIQFAPDAIFKNAEFGDLSRDALKEILKFDSINCTELQLFRACKDWATIQCERQQLTVNVANLRQLLDGVLPLLRFRTMSPKDFSICLEVAPDFWTTSELKSIKDAISTKKTKEVRREFFTCQGKWKTQRLTSFYYILNFSSADVTWVPHFIEDPLPGDAVYVGFDNFLNPIYLGRAYYGENIYPLEIIPNRRQAQYYIDDMRRDVEYFDVLCGSGYEWVRSDRGKIPAGAVVATNDSYGEPMYIGRGTSYNEFLTIGRVDVKERCIFVSDFKSGIEYEVAAFDVLVGRNVQPRKSVKTQNYKLCSAFLTKYVHFVGPNVDSVPENAILYGHDGTDEIYVGKAFYEGILLPAQINPKRGVAIVLHETGIHEVDKYTYVCGPAEWIPCRTSTIFPDNLIVGGYVNTSVPQSPIYFGRGFHNEIPVMGQLTNFDRSLATCSEGRIINLVLAEYNILVRK